MFPVVDSDWLDEWLLFTGGLADELEQLVNMTTTHTHAYTSTHTHTNTDTHTRKAIR